MHCHGLSRPAIPRLPGDSEAVVSVSLVLTPLSREHLGILIHRNTKQCFYVCRFAIFVLSFAAFAHVDFLWNQLRVDIATLKSQRCINGFASVSMLMCLTSLTPGISWGFRCGLTSPSSSGSIACGLLCPSDFQMTLLHRFSKQPCLVFEYLCVMCLCTVSASLRFLDGSWPSPKAMAMHATPFSVTPVAPCRQVAIAMKGASRTGS